MWLHVHTRADLISGTRDASRNPPFTHSFVRRSFTPKYPWTSSNAPVQLSILKWPPYWKIQSYIILFMSLRLTLSTIPSFPVLMTSLMMFPALLAAATLADNTRSIRGADMLTKNSVYFLDLMWNWFGFVPAYRPMRNIYTEIIAWCVGVTGNNFPPTTHALARIILPDYLYMQQTCGHAWAEVKYAYQKAFHQISWACALGDQSGSWEQ